MSEGLARFVIFFFCSLFLMFLFSYMRKFSQWPTYPQLYIAGKFIGGLDVAKVCEKTKVLVCFWLFLNVKTGT